LLVCFLFCICKFAKISQNLVFFETNCPNHLFWPWRLQKLYFLDYVFRHFFYFVNKSSYVSCSDLQVHENIAPFSFFETNGPNKILWHGDRNICVFRKKKLKTFVTKVRVFVHVFLVWICMFAKKLQRLVFFQTNGPNHFF